MNLSYYILPIITQTLSKLEAAMNIHFTPMQEQIGQLRYRYNPNPLGIFTRN